MLRELTAGVRLEQKTAVVDGRRYVEGYCSVFDVPDLINDTVRPGAFAKSLAGLGESGTLPLLWNHDHAAVIGRVVELREEAKGLYYRARFSRTQRAEEIANQIDDGDVDSSSFGYFPIKASGTKGVNRSLEQISIFEVSLAPIGLHPGASAFSSKGLGDLASAISELAYARRAYERAIEMAGQSYDATPATDELAAAFAAEARAFLDTIRGSDE